MKYLIAIVLIISTFITYEIGLDPTASRPNLNFSNSRYEFYRNIQVELLKKSKPTELHDDDIIMFSDSIMFTNGFTRFGNFYYLNGERKYFDEIMHYSNFIK